MRWNDPEMSPLQRKRFPMGDLLGYPPPEIAEEEAIS